MRWRGQLSFKFLALGLGLLLLALISIGMTMWVTRQLDGGAAAVNEAGRLRMQAWRLAHAKAGGRSHAEVQVLLQNMESSLKLLHLGDPMRPLFVPWTDESRTSFAAMNQSWNNLSPLWQAAEPGNAQSLAPLLDRFVAEVDELVTTIEQTMTRLTAVLNLFQFIMMALAVGAATFTLYVGYLYVIYPLERLRAGLHRVEAGDFSVRVDASALDELGEVAAGFNHMAGRLQSMYHGLESKVEEKTRDLEAQRARLAALYEVSTFLTEAHTLEELAQGFAQKIRRLGHADAVAVRWSDEASQRYLMLASECLPTELVEEERCLVAGTCACGQPHANAKTRVIPIIPLDHQILGHCAKVGYTSLISVPIRLQQRVLGEVDLFYRHETTLSDEEQALFDALAGHLANAVENLRTEALVREAAVGEERTMLARELHDSIAQSLAFMKIQLSLLRQSVKRDDAEQTMQVVDELDAGVKESLHDVRELLVHFRTRTNSGDIEQALRTTLKKFEHQSGLVAHLAIHGHGVDLPSDVQLQVLHVVQEALSNVRKHARAGEVWVTVDKGPPWTFVVRDNGRGFEPPVGTEESPSFGLHIMQERAERIGAQVHVHSALGQGTQVKLTLAP
jgi:two-component system, NarL family, nitrate/nitrite sensor histidine kinase NarX